MNNKPNSELAAALLSLDKDDRAQECGQLRRTAMFLACGGKPEDGIYQSGLAEDLLKHCVKCSEQELAEAVIEIMNTVRFVEEESSKAKAASPRRERIRRISSVRHEKPPALVISKIVKMVRRLGPEKGGEFVTIYETAFAILRKNQPRLGLSDTQMN